LTLTLRAFQSRLAAEPGDIRSRLCVEMFKQVLRHLDATERFALESEKPTKANRRRSWRR
jgi:hypothetical protein